MLEHPRIRQVLVDNIDSENPSGADNQQERLRRRMPTRGILRDHMPDFGKPFENDMARSARRHAEPAERLGLQAAMLSSNKMNGPKVAKFLVG